MQNIDKLNYKNQLKESVGIAPEKKVGNVHYFDNNKIQRWYIIEEGTQDIAAYSDSPEELFNKISSYEISNINDLNTIIKYRKLKTINESAVEDRLFYLDTLYGQNNNTLRKTLTESQLPVEERSYEQIMSELDAYPTQPGPAPVAQVGTQGAPAGDITGAMGSEIDFVLSDIFDEVLSKIKELRSGCEDPKRAHLYHHTYENMFETRKKWIETIKKRLEETNNIQQQPQQNPKGM
jgi:hypothetical protein